MNDTYSELWLLDVSGSMHGSRIDILRGYVKKLFQASPHVGLVPFNTTVLPVTSPDGLDGIVPDGGTNLHLALEFAATQMCGQVVVFTDGEPSDTDACFKAAANIPGVVHVIHCGDSKDRETIKFCERLSRSNGGGLVTRDIKRGESLLCNEVRSLLALPAPIAL